ncbi:hypothetical protein VNO77_37546 [Canavalia gladiata]|uniref:Uncharacterized protein n=1 Tax=Canavalia gladiata TaxID=3824 RepID=A0AAN9KC72_CANGL
MQFLKVFPLDCFQQLTMDTSMNSRQFVIFLIVLTLLVVSSEARIFPKFSTIGRKVDGKLGLHKLINTIQNREGNQKRSLLGGRLERVSPAGPDPQHH